jgi:membrane associated rhomboid family serine protease
MPASLDGQLVTLLLVGVNVAVSLWAFNQARGGPPDERFLFQPAAVARGRNLGGMLLSQFAHADAAHILFNLFTLYLFGPVVEDWLGPAGLLLVYGASAAGATLLTQAVHARDPGYRALGASGAISGVLFAAIVLVPEMTLMALHLPVPIPAPLYAVIYVAVSIWAAQRRLGNVGHEAHLGGAATGFVLAGVLSPQGFTPLVERVRDLLG